MAATLLCNWSWAQSPAGEAPVIRATRKSIRIHDGELSEEGVLVPEANPDRYFYRRSRSPRKITVVTDVESASFEVRQSEVHDLVVMLNDTQRCVLRIEPHIPLRAVSDGAAGGDGRQGTALVTLPMTIGFNNKPYISARINDGPIQGFLLDLGTTGSGVVPGSAARSGVRFNGMASMGSVGDATSTGMSFGNTVRLGPLTWTNVPLFEHRGGRALFGENGIIGNNVLEDRVVELNYTEKVFRIHATLPPLPDGYRRIPMRMIHGVPHIPVEFEEAGSRFVHWLMFDTGFENSVLINSRTASEHHMYGVQRVGSRSSRQNGKTVVVCYSGLGFGSLRATNVPVELQERGSGPYPVELLGNDLLKRFDCFIDYHGEAVHLRPNADFNMPYGRNRRVLQTLGVGLGAAVLVAALLGYRTRLKHLKPGSRTAASSLP
jgi:hypothetical protein